MQDVDTMPLGTCVKLNEEGTETPPPSASVLLRRVPEECHFPMASQESTPSHGLSKFLLLTLAGSKGTVGVLRPVVIAALFFLPRKHDQLLEPHPFQGGD